MLGDESRPTMNPDDVILSAIAHVRTPSPQPISKILSPGLGARRSITAEVNCGTKAAAAV